MSAQQSYTSEQIGRRPPIAVWGGVACIIASTVWIVAFQPSANPTLTVEPPSVTWLLVVGGLMLGTLNGVRILWALLFFFWAVSSILVIVSSAADHPGVQTVGAAVLAVLALVLLWLPSVRRYETRRLRLVLEDIDGDSGRR
jgi:hypothetical protein